MISVIFAFFKGIDCLCRSYCYKLVIINTIINKNIINITFTIDIAIITLTIYLNIALNLSTGKPYTGKGGRINEPPLPPRISICLVRSS